MPHLEIHLTKDIKVDLDVLFAAVETILNEFDQTAGVCKSRAYIAEYYKHSHVMINLYLLPKKHRDDAYSKNLLDHLKEYVRGYIPFDSYLSLQIYFRDEYYLTQE